MCSFSGAKVIDEAVVAFLLFFKSDNFELKMIKPKLQNYSCLLRIPYVYVRLLTFLFIVEVY